MDRKNPEQKILNLDASDFVSEDELAVVNNDTEETNIESVHDKIGSWSIDKIKIVKKYAKAYAIIFNKQNLKPIYIDAFAGSGEHINKETGKIVPGSPLNALNIEPPFHKYFLIDLDRGKTDNLNKLAKNSGKSNVYVINDDCNTALLGIFSKMDKYERAFCFIDPYGMHLNWEILRKAGEIGKVDVFINFPLLDMNLNALFHNPDKVTSQGSKRMTAFWGNEDWKKIAYEESLQGNFLGSKEIEKVDNLAIAKSFCQRLNNVAKFNFVMEPLAMGRDNSVFYYLLFASMQGVAHKIASQICIKYQEGKS